MNSENSCGCPVNLFAKTKPELRKAETTIRRIRFRDPDQVSNGVSGFNIYRGQSLFLSPAPGRGAYSGRKRFAPFSNQKHLKKGRESSHDDDSVDEGSPHKKSTVVTKGRVGRSRKATIEEQNANSNVKQRNKRMFSSIIDTLERFQHEEIKRQHKGSMRAEIEQKVEAATEEEKEKIRRKKENLFVTCREKKTQLRCLEKKIEHAESNEVYDANHRQMLNFIMTKSKPPTTKKCWEESRNAVEELLKARKQNLNADLNEIEGWYRKDSLPGNKENECTTGEGESQDMPETESESLVVEQEAAGVDDDSNKKNVGFLSPDHDFEPIYD